MFHPLFDEVVPEAYSSSGPSIGVIIAVAAVILAAIAALIVIIVVTHKHKKK